MEGLKAKALREQHWSDEPSEALWGPVSQAAPAEGWRGLCRNLGQGHHFRFQCVLMGRGGQNWFQEGIQILMRF